jgi:hypothetical protein
MSLVVDIEAKRSENESSRPSGRLSLKFLRSISCAAPAIPRSPRFITAFIEAQLSTQHEGRHPS